MIYKSYKIADLSPALSQTKARLEAFCREPSPGHPLPAVLICPGGGYAKRSYFEGEPVAIELLTRGAQAFVLEYSLSPAAYPQQLLEAAAALAFIRENAEKLGVDPKRIAVMGFSAGGHLAGCLANLWASEDVVSALGGDAERFRPNAAALCYAVISGRLSRVSHENIGVSHETHPMLSLENSVSDKTPPCFLWHTSDDPVVDVRHSLLMAESLREKDIPFELHIFPHGPHAMAAANVHSAMSADRIDPYVARWIDLFGEWMQTAF